MDFQSHPKMGIISYQLGDEVNVVRLERAGEFMRVVIADRAYDARVVHSRAYELTVDVNGAAHTAAIVSVGPLRYVAVDGDVFELRRPDARRARRQQSHGEDNLTASLPGLITKVLIGEGDSVQRGQPLIVLEAMKMEIKITAPYAGRITKVMAKQGQVVDRGQGLIEMTNEQ